MATNRLIDAETLLTIDVGSILRLAWFTAVTA